MNKFIHNIKEKIKLIDLIIEIVDCRIPYSSTNIDIKNIINNKKKIIILNKKDLADPVISQEWIKYYQTQNIPVLLLNSKYNNTKIIIKTINKTLKNKIIQNKNKQIKNYKFYILVIGIPNVGKSTFINSLISKKSAKVGKNPGVTKNQQLLKINKNIYFFDTPGVLPPNIQNENIFLNLSFVKAIKTDDILKEEICNFAFKKIYQNYFYLLKNHYIIPNNKNINLNNPIIIHKILVKLQEQKFNKYDKNNINLIINHFLQKLWNNKFGLISFERPNDFFNQNKTNN